jgi:bla regulator protein BlaR1
MNFVKTFLSQEVVQALGWTLLHSLWQGALVALALSVLLVFLNRQSAQVRYFIAVTALFTTMALAVFTFFSVYRSAVPATVYKTSGYALSAPATSLPLVKAESSWFDSLFSATFFSSYFEKHLPLIVTLWFMGLLVMALRMLGGLAYVQRLKNYQNQPLGERWQTKLDELRQQLGLQKPVKLLESLQVKVPMAIGYLKPVILVPVGAISGLSEKQVEAILAHELAHIYRHDYVFNLIQSLVETIFFYHPGMWWISATVRAERENCCDDIAISLCGDSLTFAGALAELEEMNYAAGPALAMAFSGRKNSLLGRIRRLVNQPKRSASFTEGFLAACIVMVSLSMISLSAMAKFGPEFEEFPSFINGVSKVKKEIVLPKADPEICVMAPASLEKIRAVKSERISQAAAGGFVSDDYVLSVSVSPDSSGKDIIIVKDKKGKIRELYVDGRKVRNRDMPEFQRIIDEREELKGKTKSKKKEYASREDLAEARAAVRKAGRSRGTNSRVYVYNNNGAAPVARYRYNYNSSEGSAPPAPPAAGVWMAPPAPMAPMKPMKPMRPMQPIAPRPDDSKAEMKEYEKEMKEYEKEVQEWENEVKSDENEQNEEWREYEREMQEYGREMSRFGKEMAEYAKAKTYVFDGAGSRSDELVDEREIERKVEREVEREVVRANERREDALARAAEHRAEAANERAKAAEIRAKAAEDRARAAGVRNERMEKLTAELRKDKLIGENDKNFTYKISNEGLSINNKKQPQETFEKYKKLFHPGLTGNSNYNEVYVISGDGKSRIISVNNENPGSGAKSAKAKEKEAKNKVKAKTDKKK